MKTTDSVLRYCYLVIAGFYKLVVWFQLQESSGNDCFQKFPRALLGNLVSSKMKESEDNDEDIDPDNQCRE